MATFIFCSLSISICATFLIDGIKYLSNATSRSASLDLEFEDRVLHGCPGTVTGALEGSWSHCFCSGETERDECCYWACFLIFIQSRTCSATFRDGVLIQLTMSRNAFTDKSRSIDGCKSHQV